MIVSNFLCSVYMACFISINPLDIGEGVRVSGEFDWIGQSIEVIGENNLCEVKG